MNFEILNALSQNPFLIGPILLNMSRIYHSVLVNLIKYGEKQSKHN